MQKTPEQLEQLLAVLDGSVPRLLCEHHGVEFWIEYLQRADEIKELAGLENYEWVASRVDQIPAKYGVMPPSQWMHNLVTTPVIAFAKARTMRRSGVR